MNDTLKYLSGFGNHFSSEALPNALPVGQNNPQKTPHGLYTELLSGSAFTQPRHENRSVWFYRIRPSVLHDSFKPLAHPYFDQSNRQSPASPNQHRWDPLQIPQEPTDFIAGLRPVCETGSPASRHGVKIYWSVANQSMTNSCFYNGDGDFLIVPQEGSLKITTEFGIIHVDPLEIVVIPRGVKFKVELLSKTARSYICENYGQPFRIPDRGPIGSHGLANERDFLTPVAHFEDNDEAHVLITKCQNHLFETSLVASPFDVVAWHGNYVPYKYDLQKFMVINSVSFDHPDPSIFTVLTSPSAIPGLANVDFVIFPPRWMVSEHTFRPPYYHRNIMSEFMGLIVGSYDAKSGGDDGFQPGGASLHNGMSAHGPDAQAFAAATAATLQPERYKDTMAFMFETSTHLTPYQWALQHNVHQKNYQNCWSPLQKHFKRNPHS